MHEAKLVKSVGPVPFSTKREYRLPDSSKAIWHSRQARKKLKTLPSGSIRDVSPEHLRALWLPRDLNWWIGTLFALGSLLFALGSVFYFYPESAARLGLDINLLYFTGSIPFSAAAYLQLYQAANTDEFPSTEEPQEKRRVLIGYKPKNIGWLGSALQFIGTLFFNIDTFAAMVEGLSWWEAELLVWTPNILGSILFFASGYLAFVEICHKHFAINSGDLSWWITIINLFGCAAFLISAIFAFIPLHPFSFNAEAVSIIWTLMGSIAFFFGSVLMLPEALRSEKSNETVQC